MLFFCSSKIFNFEKNWTSRMAPKIRRYVEPNVTILQADFKARWELESPSRSIYISRKKLCDITRRPLINQCLYKIHYLFWLKASTNRGSVPIKGAVHAFKKILNMWYVDFGKKKKIGSNVSLPKRMTFITNWPKYWHIFNVFQTIFLLELFYIIY